MNDTDRQDANESTAGSGAASSGGPLPVSTFEVVPYGPVANEQELYSYRATMPQPAAPEKQAARQRSQTSVGVFPLLGMVALIALLGAAAYFFLRPQVSVRYMDMGNQRFDAAGVSGHLIVRWRSSGLYRWKGSYQLYLDPAGPDHAASFAAMAADPLQRLSIDLRLLDADGLAVCEKQILLPAAGSWAAEEPGAAALSRSQTSETGDAVKTIAGESGRIAEIDLSGSLPCSLKTYDTIKSWGISADFSPAGAEDARSQQEKGLDTRNHAAQRSSSARTTPLTAPIEGDDMIVGDNPSHGTIETSGGHIFFLGAAGMRNRTAAWQVFPSPIHFRCDKNGACSLTRPGAPDVLRARLLQ